MVDNQQAVIGAILLEVEAIDNLDGMVTLNDFTGRNKIIFQHIEALVSERAIPDFIALRNRLKEAQCFDQVGGEYLEACIHHSVTADNIKYYARQVRQESVIRQIKGFGNEIVNHAGTADELMALVEEKAFAFESKGAKGPEHIVAGMKRAMKQLDKACSAKGELMGLTTGVTALDGVLNGLQPGRVYLIAGRPAMGKSAFALDLVRRNPTVTSLFCSMEMENVELAFRGMCSEAKVDGSVAQSGKLGASEFNRLTDAAARLMKSNIWIDDRAAQNVGQLYATARKMKRTNNLGLLVVDYLQLMEGNGNEYEIIGNASKMFKRIAKDLKIPVVVLSQLNRSLESREDKRPRLSDLRGSGQIEQDADVVMFPFRPAVYCECMGVSDCDKNHRRDAEIIIAKHRGGKIGMAKAQYIGEHTTFIDAPKTTNRQEY